MCFVLCSFPWLYREIFKSKDIVTVLFFLSKWCVPLETGLIEESSWVSFPSKQYGHWIWWQQTAVTSLCLMPLTVIWPVSGPYHVPVIVSEWSQTMLALGVLAIHLERWYWRHLGQKWYEKHLRKGVTRVDMRVGEAMPNVFILHLGTPHWFPKYLLSICYLHRLEIQHEIESI